MRTKVIVYILSFLAIAMLIAGLLLPPMGIIDSSVIAAVGEVIGIITLIVFMHSVEKGIDAKFTHGKTTVELNNSDK